ncbi:Predicted transcriptional regulator [Bryocella elongata]|uniref:Predicted transcriptional regulator n=1 Tax=Bryocella elongata TaxID=863522 RepID=A0A1H5TXE7_9BACT|nr:BlaI/MecI/CopY family transcriptional regulator [Bryocella elongata]SEF67542.1 Predicted transcriptional regulator [Bryocella elongata]
MSESTPIPAEVADFAAPEHPSARLGHREREVLDIVWAEGSGTVEEVSRRLPIRLAYTTVMTTLDRLFKKGLLLREKHDRAFRYSPAVSPQEVESQRARALVDRFLQSTTAQPEMLISCLVDALGEYDGAMLDQLEDKIRAARESLTLADAAAKELAQ